MCAGSPLMLMVGASESGVGPGPGNRTYVGQDIFVAAGQQVHNATCFFARCRWRAMLRGVCWFCLGA